MESKRLLTLLESRQTVKARTYEGLSNLHCRELEKLHLVSRHRQSHGEYARPYHYALTELGSLVLLYLAPEREVKATDDVEREVKATDDVEREVKARTRWRKNRAKGLCGWCGKVPPMPPKHSLCEECTVKNRLGNLRFAQKRGQGVARG